ncbi:bifunctional alpha/beta hydrolase/OsmC family protein [Hyphococcus lacteus]|uniref:Alpha/beta fold hydrolase n=1 Tax=Hyphococcus lacteus TaxID=3143536 RepID=A0ABV3Z039_9PROT
MTGETKKTEFKTKTGETLAAALELPAQSPRAFALFAHCFSCTKDIKSARELARALRAAGFAVLRFDFTGLGSSEGDFSNTNFSSNVDDLVSAADYLRTTYSAPSLIIGHSLGGAAALVAAERIPEVKGVAVIGAPAEADHVAMQIGESRAEIEEKGHATVKLAGRPFTIKKQFLDDIENQNVLESASRLKKPLLIMHAPLDQTVGIENATKIFVAAKHPKSFVSLDTADHLLSSPKDAHYAASVLEAWAGRFIDGPAKEIIAATPEPAQSAPAFNGGALAQNISGEPFAVALSIDGYPMLIDAGKEDGGHDLGPNPTRTLEAALAACGVMTIKMYARRKKWNVEDVEIRIRRAKSEDAHVPHLLEKELRITGDLDETQRARLLEIADKCPVHRVLTEGVTVNSRIV